MTATVPTTSTRHPLRVVLLLGFLLSAAMAAAEEGTLYTLQADGLACPFCAYGIEKQLYRIDGVASVSTDVNRGTVIITMKPGATLTETDAGQAVAAAGFTMREFRKKDSPE